MPMYRAVPIQASVKSRCEFPWRRHIGIALHTVRNVIGVFLMHARQCKGCEAIGRHIGRSIGRRDREKTEQQGNNRQGWFHLLSSCRTQTTPMCHITLRCPITNFNGENHLGKASPFNVAQTRARLSERAAAVWREKTRSRTPGQEQISC